MKNRLQCLIRKWLMPVLLCFAFSAPTYSQHFTFGNEQTSIEAGLNFGPTFFLGDLGGGPGYGSKFVKDVNLEVTKMMKGGFISVYPNKWMGIRLGAQYTFVEGRDNLISTNGTNELYRKQRNLDFKSNMWEVYGAMEFFPLMWLHRNDEEYAPRWRPYGFAGAGVFHFNPKGSLKDAYGNVKWYDLKPLRTEGQGMSEYPNIKEYSLTQINIPMGFGIKYYTSSRVNMGMEILYRTTFTDYIDDVSTAYIDPRYFEKYLTPEDANVASQIYDKVSAIVNQGLTRNKPGIQRGNPNNTDAYFSVLLKIGIRIGQGGDGYGDYGSDADHGRNWKKRMRCPARF